MSIDYKLEEILTLYWVLRFPNDMKHIRGAVMHVTCANST